GPRKVIVGTAMHNMFCPYPGLSARLQELAGLVDRMVLEATNRYQGAGLDIAVLPENAINGGQEGTAQEMAYPLDGPVLDVIGAKAREHNCYIVAPLYLVDDREQGLYSNAAALIDRSGGVAGVYRKYFAVVYRGAEEAEKGVMPGNNF